MKKLILSALVLGSIVGCNASESGQGDVAKLVAQAGYGIEEEKFTKVLNSKGSEKACANYLVGMGISQIKNNKEFLTEFSHAMKLSGSISSMEYDGQFCNVKTEKEYFSVNPMTGEVK